MKQGYVKPGSVLGILGGGQLGRMFAMSAHAMGYQVAVLDPDSNSPAGAISEHHIQADYEDEKALDQLIALCGSISTEFENVPSKVMEYLEAKVQGYPPANAVAIAQNRMKEKTFFLDNGIATTPFISVESVDDLDNVDLNFPCILKTAKFGYDGKGQVVCKTVVDAKKGFQLLNMPCILEQMVALEREVSVILARGVDSEIAYFPIAENVHKNGILDTTTVPANINSDLEQQIKTLAYNVATAINYVGVLAIEFFISKTGKVMVNEMAPRPHNSGHYTMNACHTSQFEQQVRAMAHLPLGDTTLVCPTVMLNILGDSWKNGEPDWKAILNIDNVFLHLYGKKQARNGRKMGHINVLADSAENVSKKVVKLKPKLRC
jgi:5-(carboxyamino)imidazole ribonucleotide synthase